MAKSTALKTTDNDTPQLSDPLDGLLDAQGGHGNGIIDVQKALKLRLNNKLSYKNIAATISMETGYKISAQAVWERLRPFTKIIEDPTVIQAYEQNKENLLSAAEMRLLQELLDEDKLKKAATNNIAYAFQQIFTANRLQRDKSTANIGVHGTVTHYQEELETLKKQREEIMKTLE